jgi:hypothetical protein
MRRVTLNETQQETSDRNGMSVSLLGYRVVNPASIRAGLIGRRNGFFLLRAGKH